MKIAVTGHRPHKLGHDYSGTSVLSERIYDELAAVVRDNWPREKGLLVIIFGSLGGFVASHTAGVGSLIKK